MSRARILAAGALAAALSCSLISPAIAKDHRPKPADPRAAVQLYTQDVPSLGTVGGVAIDGAGFGSSFTAKPGSSTIFYGLTDRGPNVDGPNGTKVEPLPNFAPAIGEFVLDKKGKAKLIRTIALKAADGTPYNGQASLSGNTGETITDLTGKTLPASPYGYDPEGLVVLKDGTFWVSDEYGPFITHFSRDGRQLERLTPFDGSLPVELAEREPNKGMEGLTVTPDGSTLVGIMQAGLNAPDGPKSKNVSALRIVTVNLRTRQTAQYLYLLHNSDGANTTVSEIAALNAHEFLVDERDSKVEPNANKKLFRIDLRGATDVSKNSTLPGAVYDVSGGGLKVGGKTIEGLVGKKNSADAASTLKGAGITPVSSRLFLDVGGLVTAIDPTGGFFGHDKVEGVAVINGGKQIVLSNDSDFGIDALVGDQPPYQLKAKLQPNGQAGHRRAAQGRPGQGSGAVPRLNPSRRMARVGVDRRPGPVRVVSGFSCAGPSAVGRAACCPAGS